MPEPAYQRRRHDWRLDLNTVGLRTERWKYVRYSTGEVEVYDLRDDPGELVNVAGRPELRRTERLLAREWRRLSTCAGDSCRAPLPPGLE